MEPTHPPLIGKNIQAIRKKKGYTLDSLSEKSGVSKAMLSQIESEKVNPTVATVWKIAQGLNVVIEKLLKGSLHASRRFVVSRNNDITTLTTDKEGVHIKVLSSIQLVEDLEMYLITFQPNSVLRSAAHFPHTEEFLTLISGHMKVSAGENISELYTGDFINYHCDINHTIENIGSEKAIVHLVVRFAQNKLRI